MRNGVAGNCRWCWRSCYRWPRAAEKENVGKGLREGKVAGFGWRLLNQTDYAASFYNRGCLKGIHGDTDGALADFDRAIQINPELRVTPHGKFTDQAII